MNVDVDVEVDIKDKAGDRGVERDQLDGTMQGDGEGGQGGTVGK